MTRRLSRPACALLTCAVAALLAVPLAPAFADDPAASIYQPGTVAGIELALEPAAIAGLESAPDVYQPGTFAFAPDATPAGGGTYSAPRKVEVKLKGHASFRSIKDGKAAFKLKFKAADAFFGLRKMTLNNMVEDPSMIHEVLSYAAFGAAGVPAPRAGFAFVRVNGEDFGLYLDLETLDKVALEKRFGPFDKEVQHLYEGEEGDDVRPGSALDFEVDEGEEGADKRADLEALIDAVNSTGPEPWSTRVAPAADLQEMTRMWAVERYVGQRDGYTGVEAPYQPNNYYLYSDSAGRFQMLPWGTDETWLSNNHLGFGEGIGLMFDRCLEDAACTATYRDSLGTACGAVGGAELDTLATDTAKLLAPWQQREQADSRHEYDLAEIADAVAETRAFVASRQADAEHWLGAPCEAPPVSDPTPPLPPSTPGPGTTTSTLVPTAPPSAGAAFHAGRPQIAGQALSTRLTVPGAGTVLQGATISTSSRKIVACRRSLDAGAPGDLTLTCPLTPAVRRHLRARWLRAEVVTSFQPPTGPPETVTYHVRLPRLD